MAEIITATIQKKRKSDTRVAEILSLFQKAEERLKKAEHQCNGLHIPSLNELRYVGHHLLNGLNAVVPSEIEYEFQEAESHCKRAIFDAVEIRLIDHLQRIERFEYDFREIEIVHIVTDYLALRGKYLAVKKTLREVDQTCREEYLEKCEEHLAHLESFTEAIDLAKPELQKAIARERKDSRTVLINITIGLLGLSIAIAGVAIAYYHH